MTVYSDTEVRDNIENSLRWEPRVDVRDIAVAVKDGIATLNGKVHHYGEKFDAERITSRTSGVQGVANEIEIQSHIVGEASDTDIAEAAVQALKWRYSVPQKNIRVVVEKGWLKLEGEVAWSYQRRDAEAAVRHLAGVKGVIDQITVTPRVNEADVGDSIRAAFERTALLDANSISVSVNDDEVTLRGEVHSWDERSGAARAAEDAPGVKIVHNQLTVS